MYLGIDFGTSYSKVATLYLGQPLLLQNPGEYGLPSEFYYSRESGILIGQDALDAGQGDEAVNLVSEIKMLLQARPFYGLDHRIFFADDIVRAIYKAVLLKAVQVAKKRALNTEIEGVVISVPAKFGMQERHLIVDAAKTCLDTKLPIRAIIKEPVAAALAYYNTSLEDNTHILVYDLGGGTCDIALVRSDTAAAEHYTVVDSDMIRLGGRNWDEELEKYITAIIEKKSGSRICGNTGYEEKVRRTAIAVKHDLSDPSKERSIARVELNGRIYTAPVSRKVFDEITAHLLRQTFDCLQEVYDRNIDACKIEEIICVGGSSNMLQVEEGLLRRFPRCRIRIYEPEHAVVNGAAIYAHMPQAGTLVDVASFSYGTDSNTHYGHEDNQEIISNILIKGTPLPAVCSKSYRPLSDGQSSMLFRIYESEHTEEKYARSDRNKTLIGQVELTLPSDIKRTTSVHCQMRLNVDGMLEVEAHEPSGRQVKSVFKIHVL